MLFETIPKRSLENPTACPHTVLLALFAQPAMPLHSLKGSWRGFWSVQVSHNWRIVFGFKDGEAVDVDLVDHH